MSRKHKPHEEVFAVLRWDAFQSSSHDPEVQVTVKEIVSSQELAEAEVARLREVNREKNVRYWWQPTRLFPEGSSAGASHEAKPGGAETT